MLCFILLSLTCDILYCTTLYYTLLNSTKPCQILYCTLQYYIILYYNMLYVALFNSTKNLIYCITLCYAMLYYTIL